MPKNAVRDEPYGRKARDFVSFTSSIPCETPVGPERGRHDLASGARWLQEVAPRYRIATLPVLPHSTDAQRGLGRAHRARPQPQAARWPWLQLAPQAHIQPARASQQIRLRHKKWFLEWFLGQGTAREPFREKPFETQCVAHLRVDLERVMGIEPTLAAWEAAVLPLNYTRVDTHLSGCCDLRILHRRSLCRWSIRTVCRRWRTGWRRCRCLGPW